MIEKGTQTGPPTRDMATQTDWIEDAGTQTDPIPPSHASLMGLPTELRLQICELALIAYRDGHCPRLRKRDDLEFDEDNPWHENSIYQNVPPRVKEAHIANAALLRINRQLNREVTEVFYAGNKFHYSILLLRAEPNWSTGEYIPEAYMVRYDTPVYDVGMEDMTDLSVDYVGKGQCRSEKAVIDEDLAGHINLIASTCPRLRFFTVHLVWERCSTHIHQALTGTSKTATALAAIAVRDRLSIVALKIKQEIAGLVEYTDLLNAIAPESCWEARATGTWPEISLSEVYIDGLKSIDEEPWGREIWRWDLDTSRRPRQVEEVG